MAVLDTQERANGCSITSSSSLFMHYQFLPAYCIQIDRCAACYMQHKLHKVQHDCELYAKQPSIYQLARRPPQLTYRNDIMTFYLCSCERKTLGCRFIFTVMMEQYHVSYTHDSQLYVSKLAANGSIRHIGDGLTVVILHHHLLCSYVPHTICFYLHVAYRQLSMQHVMCKINCIKFNMTLSCTQDSQAYVSQLGDSTTCNVQK